MKHRPNDKGATSISDPYNYKYELPLDYRKLQSLINMSLTFYILDLNKAIEFNQERSCQFGSCSKPVELQGPFYPGRSMQLQSCLHMY